MIVDAGFWILDWGENDYMMKSVTFCLLCLFTDIGEDHTIGTKTLVNEDMQCKERTVHSSFCPDYKLKPTILIIFFLFLVKGSYRMFTVMFTNSLGSSV